MKINHFIIGSTDVIASTLFYCELLGFKKIDDDPGAKGGQVLTGDGLELLILPFPKERLPNPAHFAIEVADEKEFKRLLEKSSKMGLAPRSEPPRNSIPGPSEFSRGQNYYRNFYIFDPSGVNLEVMVQILKSVR